MDQSLIEIPNVINDRLGCYRVGNLKFYSKVDAIEAMQKTGTHLHWDFNEAVFSCYDWTKEPDTPILELYRRRAQQLRDKYDYIVLHYSGGSDSQTILEAFIDNDIKLDEIVTHVNYKATGDKDNYLNSEACRVAIPQIEKLKETRPWLNHRIMDFTDLTLDYFSVEERKFDWMYDLNNFFNPNGTCRVDLGMKIKEWHDLIYSGKKVCMLWGIDKPRVYQINGKFVFRFLDFIDGGPTVKSLTGKQPYEDELFYWTPDMPELIIKQAHIIKNYLSKDDIERDPWVGTEKSDLAYRTINGKTLWLNKHRVNQLIYPKWDINTYSSGKGPSLIISSRDTWFFQVEEAISARRNWRIGIQKLWEFLPDYWKNNPADISSGIKGCWSKDYFLE